MRSAWKSWALFLAVAGVFFGGVIGLFNREFASGELYPEFSTMRTDPLGTRLLYDSLAKLPDITVERNFLPMQFMPRDSATLLLLGVGPYEVNWNVGMLLRMVDETARRGNRVIVALHFDPKSQGDLDRPADPTAPVKKQSASNQPEEAPLKTMWRVGLKLDSDRKKPYRLYFDQAAGWTIHEQAGDKILAIERDLGKGSVVLMADSAEFTNRSVAGMDRLDQIVWAFGAYRLIVFDEQHLGIAESGSIIGMARQFRLTGLALGLGLCAALFIWRNASGFPPPAAARAVDRFAGRTSHAGLLTLLKRHIAPGDLAAVCWREWLAANARQATPEVRAQAEAIVKSAAARPVEATRQIQALLHPKGEL
ncbi:MAG TPA: DUF4350 domain-containing protein [Bryobacteraceae bacterium]|jgi:hypothetical protein